MRRRTLMIALSIAALALAGGAASAGDYHVSTTLICSDCHTMHFSMQHGWAGGTVSTGAPAATGSRGDWLGTTGPNEFLLKAPANELCLSCHDGWASAPDVLGENFNTSPTSGRSAGAINDPALGAPYDTFKGHTLDATDVPPGYDPTKVGLSATWYNNTEGLECISCHIQHGSASVYRNLGPRALTTGSTAVMPNRPSYVKSTTDDTTKDVWINIASQTGTVGDRTAADFNPYYSYANITFNRIDGAPGGTKASNAMDVFCGACHGNFHGGPGDTEIGASAAVLDGFIRHPTSQVNIGDAGVQGYGGHSSLTRFVANTTKTRVYANDRTTWADASPGCISCHKAHGNQNPFGLFFLNRAATSVDEQGGWGATEAHTTEQGLRNLCGQCHSQGN